MFVVCDRFVIVYLIARSLCSMIRPYRLDTLLCFVGEIMAEPSVGPSRRFAGFVRFCKALACAVLLPMVVLVVAWLGSGGSAQAGVRVRGVDGLPAGGASPTTTPCA